MNRNTKVIVAGEEASIPLDKIFSLGICRGNYEKLIKERDKILKNIEKLKKRIPA